MIANCTAGKVGSLINIFLKVVRPIFKILHDFLVVTIFGIIFPFLHYSCTLLIKKFPNLFCYNSCNTNFYFILWYTIAAFILSGCWMAYRQGFCPSRWSWFLLTQIITDQFFCCSCLTSFMK